ncbi:hypothetical protein ScPMuIL_003120 [Solemya velum]
MFHRTTTGLQRCLYIVAVVSIIPPSSFGQGILTRVGDLRHSLVPDVGVSVQISPSVGEIRFPSVADRMPVGAAVPIPVDTSRFVQDVADVQLERFATAATTNIEAQLSQDLQFFRNGIDKPVSQGGIPFGPHLLTSQTAIDIGKIGSLFVDISVGAATNLGLNASVAGAVVSKIGRQRLPPQTSCPFINVRCNPLAKYRSIDGSCNNLAHGLWGRAETPFERDFPPMYGDGISTPRTMDITNVNPLPLARVVSTAFHQQSFASHLMPDITHFSMEYGQFLSHDIQRNALSRGKLGQHGIDSLCKRKILSVSPSCFPIEIPTTDNYFSQFNRTCMNFVRAIPTPNLQCTLGPRQQLNQNTHFIDASQIYGSDSTTSNSLRLLSGGKILLLSASLESGTKLPKDTSNTAGCILPSSNVNVKCFRAGDVRANQQPALATLHTIWMREHNRVADKLHLLNVDWDDEQLYQEARKIVGAMLQHITYNEYLPYILGSQTMTQMNLSPLSSGYFTGYDSNLNPTIRNSFASAAFRFGHSKVHDYMASHSSTSSSNHLWKDVFLKPDLMYDANSGVTGVARGLVQTQSQKVDRLMTTQLTRHMFERFPGTGLDLAAINIQRGRDHGTASYAIWRIVCNLSVVGHFGVGIGGLVDHTPADAAALQSIYGSVYDIDLYTGGVSEKPVPGSKLGPTFNCLVAKQFQRLKYGDRFFYESNNAAVKFSPDQLNTIRGETMAKIMCRNTGVSTVQPNVFQMQAPGNMPVSCNTMPDIDLSPWQQCIDGGWSTYGSWSLCVGGVKIRIRYCNNPVPNHCGQTCPGSPFDIQLCPSASGRVRARVDVTTLRKNLDLALGGSRKVLGSVDSILRQAVSKSSVPQITNTGPGGLNFNFQHRF